MTCIMWDGLTKQLYADSNIVKGDERFTSLNKIMALSVPIIVTSIKNPRFNDVILGWTSTGTMACARKFVNSLHVIEIDKLLLVYEVSERQDLACFENFFEVLLIGKAANYSFKFGPGEVGYQVYEHSTSWGVGSGGLMALDTLIDQKADPVRAMWSALYRDQLSGGIIDVWRLHTDRNHQGTVFMREGMVERVYYEDIPPRLIPIDKPYPLDFITRRTDADIVIAMKEQQDALSKIIAEAEVKAEKAKSTPGPLASKQLAALDASLKRLGGKRLTPDGELLTKSSRKAVTKRVVKSAVKRVAKSKPKIKGVKRK
jgi:hypothetical protein